MSPALAPGAVRLRDVSRSFRILHERNQTLKETLLRRRRTVSTELWALRHVDLDIAPGESIGIIGQNGSGKSTLLKLVADILHPQTGTIEVGGRVASMLELGAGFHPDFTGRENVYLNAAIHGLSDQDVDRDLDRIVAFSELEEFIDMPVKTYSSGMQMRLAFSVASHVDADVLLLDEVLAVGDEAFQRKCFGRIAGFRRRGGTLLLVSHDARAIETMCDRVLYLDQGELVIDAPPAVALARYHERLAGAARGHADEADAPGREGSASYGNSRVTIAGVRLINHEGESTTRFLGGEPMRIEIDYRFSDLSTPDGKFGVRVNHPTGEILFGVNNIIDDTPLATPRPQGTVVLDIARIPLFQGQFTISVGVCSVDDSELYHQVDNITEFSVFAPAVGEGLVFVERRWSLGELRQSALTSEVPG